MDKTGRKGYGGVLPGAGIFALAVLLALLLAIQAGNAGTTYDIGGGALDYTNMEKMVQDLTQDPPLSFNFSTGDTYILHQDDNTISSSTSSFYGTLYIRSTSIITDVTITSATGEKYTISRNGEKQVSGTLGGNGGGFLQISGHGTGIATPSHNTISNLTFTGWNVVSDGSQNTFRGGGVLLLKKTTDNTISNVTFSNNSVSTHYQSTAGATSVGYGGGGGGAVFLNYGADNNKLIDVTFANNTVNAITSGLNSGTMTGGGALYIVNNTGNTLENVQFTGNTANVLNTDSGGGAAYLLQADNVTMKDVRFANNSVSQTGTGSNRIAYGGTLYVKDSDNLTFDGSVIFTNNTAQAANGASYGGAVYYSNSGGAGKDFIYTGIGISSTAHFSGNSAYAGSGTAAGGAIYVAGGASAIIKDTVFDSNVVGRKTENGVVSISATGRGGALYLTDGGSISGSTFNKNQAFGSSTAQGGAIYVEKGNLNLTNVSFTDNSVIGTNSNSTTQGGAVYFSGTGNIDMKVEANKTATISGNRTNTGEANGFYINQTGSGTFDLNVDSGGTMAMLDPMTVVANGIGASYQFKKTGSGDFTWDGLNTFSAGGVATIDIQGGTLRLGDSFSLKADGTTKMDVKIANVDAVTFGLDRSGDLAMFDFRAGATTNDSSSLTIQDGTKLTTELGRSITSFDKSYVIVAGLDEDKIHGKFVLETNYPEYVTLSNPLRYNNAEAKLYADITFTSPFDTSGPNAKSAQNALEAMLTGHYKVDISDAEYVALLRNAAAAVPELFMEQTHISMDSADRMSRTAIDYGLRYPHRNRGQDGMTVGGGDYYEEYDEYAYPSLAVCEPDQGLRFWTGYVGDWRNENAHSGYNGYKADRHGVLVGVNYDFSDAATMGIYGGYSHIDVKAKRITSSTKTNAAHFGIQGRLSPLVQNRDLSFYGDMAYHYYDNEMSRDVGGWGASGGFKQDILTIGAGVEHVFRLDNYNITPHAEMRYFYLDQDALREGGSSITTTEVSGFNKGAFNSRLGVEASKEIPLTNGVFIPAINLSWRHEYGNKTYSSKATFVNNATYMPFGISSSPNDRDSLDAGIALKGSRYLSSGNRMGLNLSYNLNVSSRSSTHSVFAGFDVGF